MSRIKRNQTNYKEMNKLKTTLLLLSIIMFGSLQATIIYTDIPDGQPMGIDFNQDGTMEFDIMDNMGIGDGLNYWANANNNIYAIDAANWDVPLDLELNDVIDANGNWDGAGDAAVVGWGGAPAFTIGVDRYLGMKFDLGGNIYYGWVRVEVIQNGLDPWGDPAYEVIYKDYAYEDVANTAILAGAIPVVGNVDVTGVTVTGQGGVTTIVEASTLQMVAAILPANATDQTVTWSVTNGTGTATINAAGLLIGLTQGTVTVIATANDGSGVTGQLVITITGPIDVTGITITGQGGLTTVAETSTLQMVAAILPANAADQTVTWSVTNGTGTATINATGLLSGLTQGTVTVIATANDGSGITGQLVITITGPIDVTGITVTGQGGLTTVAEASTLQMLAAILPANATDQTVTWSVTNGTGTATISATGLLSGLTQGTVTVMATANDGSGIVGQLVITITGPIDVAEITVTGQGGLTTVAEASTLQMLAAILPANATDQTVTWSVTNGTGTATINATGLLSGLTQGTVTVIATANDGSGITGQLVITVTGTQNVLIQNLTILTPNGQDIITDINGTLQMIVSIYPGNATNQTVTWEVVNQTGAATISASGLLTAVSNGTVLVKVSANDASGLTAEKVITINMEEEVNGIDNEEDFIINVYPNPFTNQITVNSSMIDLITVVDLSGKIVYKEKVEHNGFLIDLNYLEVGIYMLILQTEENYYTQKVIKK